MTPPHDIQRAWPSRTERTRGIQPRQPCAYLWSIAVISLLACSESPRAPQGSPTTSALDDVARPMDTDAALDTMGDARSEAMRVDTQSPNFGRDVGHTGSGEWGGSENLPPLGGSDVDAGMGHSIGNGEDMGEPGAGRGTDDGSNEQVCEDGMPVDIVLTDDFGIESPSLAVQLLPSEDGGEYFALGLKADQWPSDAIIELVILYGDFPVAEGQFSRLMPQCIETGWWRLRDLRMSLSPSTEVNEVLDVELGVRGSIRGALEEGQVRFESTIRLLY